MNEINTLFNEAISLLLNKETEKDLDYIDECNKFGTYESILKFKFNANNYEKVIVFLSIILKLSKDHLFSLEVRSQIYLNLNKYDLAINDCTSLINIDNLNRNALRVRSDIYFKLKKYNLAVIDFTSLINIDNLNQYAYEMRKLCYEFLGDFREAIFDYNFAKYYMYLGRERYSFGILYYTNEPRSFIDGKGGFKCYPPDVDFFNNAYLFFLDHGYFRYLSEFKRNLNLNTDNVAEIMLKATALRNGSDRYSNHHDNYFNIEYAKKSLVELFRIVEIDKNNIAAYLQIISIYFVLSNWELALKNVEIIHKIKPDFDLYYEKAICFLKIDRHEEALKQIEMGINKNHKNYRLFELLENCYFRCNEFGKLLCIKITEECIIQNQHNYHYYSLLEFLLKTHCPEKALKLIELGIKKNKDDRKLYDLLKICYFHCNELEKLHCIKIIEDGIVLNQQNNFYYSLLESIYCESKEYYKALCVVLKIPFSEIENLESNSEDYASKIAKYNFTNNDFENCIKYHNISIVNNKFDYHSLQDYITSQLKVFDLSKDNNNFEDEIFTLINDSSEEAKSKARTFDTRHELEFGKYKGRTLKYIIQKEPNYILWCVINVNWFAVENSIFINPNFIYNDQFPLAIKYNHIKTNKLWDIWFKERLDNENIEIDPYENYSDINNSFYGGIYGCSDDTIDECFDGDPDNYWNID